MTSRQKAPSDRLGLLWEGVLSAATAPRPQSHGDIFQAHLVPIEDPRLHGALPRDVAALPTAGFITHAFVADARTMADHTMIVIVIELSPDSTERGRWFRVASHAVQSVQNNLSLHNMDFKEFADDVDPADEVFRGFTDLPAP